MTLSLFFINGRDKFRKIESTDLSGENINEISLMEKYNENAVEKILGKLYKKIEEKKYDIYSYATHQSRNPSVIPVGELNVDKNNNIISIAIGSGATPLKTNKGITKGATFSDVRQAYGNYFLEEKYTGFMGSSDGYFITYVDKNNKYQLKFEFNNDVETLANVSLSKY